MTLLAYVANDMAADDLATQGAKDINIRGIDL